VRLKIQIFILAQLNRASDKEQRPPRLSDLRESGNIEQDCDRVHFIHRPTHNKDDVDQSNASDYVQYQYIIEKNRYGPSFILHWMQFCGPFQRLTEVDVNYG
jgi:replicative DNA helicase